MRLAAMLCCLLLLGCQSAPVDGILVRGHLPAEVFRRCEQRMAREFGWLASADPDTNRIATQPYTLPGEIERRQQVFVVVEPHAEDSSMVQVFAPVYLREATDWTATYSAPESDRVRARVEQLLRDTLTGGGPW